VSSLLSISEGASAGHRVGLIQQGRVFWAERGAVMGAGDWLAHLREKKVKVFRVKRPIEFGMTGEP
jgi:hypothetical protein